LQPELPFLFRSATLKGMLRPFRGGKVLRTLLLFSSSLVASLLAPSATKALTNGLALTPPMGLNTWYQHGPYIDEAFIKLLADSMATNGLRDAGYQYLCLDDGWQGYRDALGNIVADTNKFPNGLQSLADYVHAKGLKIGIYTGFGVTTCVGLPGSCGHIAQDANTFASWGIDYLKYEGCSPCGPDDSVHTQCQLMGEALRNCGRPILFNMSILGAEDWMPAELNSWRGTGDNSPSFNTVYAHLDFVAQTPELAGPGHWNDPDVLMTYYGGFSRPEKMSMFGMWSMVAAPLLIAGWDDSCIDILTNREVIAIDQDPAGIQGVCVLTNGDLQVWAKPLGSNSTSKAVALLNRGTVAADITATWAVLGLSNGVVGVRDLWARAWAGNFTNSYTVNVPPHGCQMVKIVSGTTVPLPPVGTNYLSDLEWGAATVTTNQYPTQLDRNVQGGPLRLHGTTYAKGLGTFTWSRIEYLLSGAASRFISDIGVDDAACCGAASLDFRVWGDGRLLYDSGTVTSSSPVANVDVDISGCDRLVLEVTNAVAGSVNNQADWAAARIIVSGIPVRPSAATSGRRVDLSWFPVSGATGYHVWKATNSGGPYALIGSPVVTSFTDTNLVSDTLYYYAISAVIGAVDSARSPDLLVEVAAGWNNTTTAVPQNWNVNGNWTNTASFPNRAGKPVELTANIAGDQTILLNQQITIGSLSMGDPDGSGSYTVAGNGGALAFDNGPSDATITQLSPSKGDTLACAMDFSNALQILNLSTNALTIAGSNSFAGQVNLRSGALRLGSASALGSAVGGSTIEAGATLDLNGFNIGPEPLLVSGSGASSAGAIINSATPTGVVLSLTLMSDATFGGGGDWRIGSTNDSVAAAVLSCQGKRFNLVKAGSNAVALRSVNVDSALGDIDIQQGTLSFEMATTTMGDSARNLIVEPGANLALRDCVNPLNKQLVLNSDGVTCSLTNVSGSNVLTGPILLGGDCGIAVGAATLALTGALSGDGALLKFGSGSLSISGPVTYTGATTVKAGALRFLNTGALSSSFFRIESGGILDLSGVSNGVFTLAPGRTLAGSGSVVGNFVVGTQCWLAPDASSTLNFSNNVTFNPDSGGCAMTVGKQPLTNSQIRVAGNLTLGGVLVITAYLGTSGFVSGDQFQLFSAGSFSGGFAQIIPPVPAPGFVWDTTNLTNHGVLRVVATQLPQLGAPRITANTVQLAGNGGMSSGPGDTWYILSSTNVALPMSQWSRLSTGQFDANNNFLFTDPNPMTGGRILYYRLQLR
jgi:alpha-galactosidase